MSDRAEIQDAMDKLLAALNTAIEVQINVVEVSARQQQRKAEGLPGLTDDDVSEFIAQAAQSVADI